jgi:NAD-dependent deacetylase
MFVVGTSGLVYPAATLPTRAAESGATIIQVNPAPTSLDGAVDHNLSDPAGDAMVAVIEAAWRS